MAPFQRKKWSEAHFANTRPYLEGVLRNNNTGEVIPNAPITVTDLKTGEEIQTQTNEKGEYSDSSHSGYRLYDQIYEDVSGRREGCTC